MTVPARLNHNSTCDRCGQHEDVPRGYGFHKGYNLCRFCQEEWEKIIRNKYNTTKWHTFSSRGEWHIYAGKLLTQFVKNKPKERVEFT